MAERTTRIASWNVRKAIGRDMRRDPARVLDAIAAMAPDVIALQEADLRFAGRGAIFTEGEIACRGLRPVHVGDGHPGLGWHGNVLLVSERVHVEEAGEVILRGLEPRGAIRADLRIGARPLRIVSAHLALMWPVRLHQARALAAEAGDGPAIVLGDFNAWRADPISLRPLARTMALAPTPASFPASRPAVRLDRIYHRGLSEPTRAGARREAAVASDHVPVWADFPLAD